MKQFFDGIGRTMVPMWIILSSNLLNILGNYLLIFGKWGCPELGLFGAGLSTLLSRVYMLVALWVVLRSSRDLRAVYRACLKRRFLPAYFGRLFRLGLPIGIQTGGRSWSMDLRYHHRHTPRRIPSSCSPDRLHAD